MKLVFLTLTAVLFTVISRLAPLDQHQKVSNLSPVAKARTH